MKMCKFRIHLLTMNHYLQKISPITAAASEKIPNRNISNARMVQVVLKLLPDIGRPRAERSLEVEERIVNATDEPFNKY